MILILSSRQRFIVSFIILYYRIDFILSTYFLKMGNIQKYLIDDNNTTKNPFGQPFFNNFLTFFSRKKLVSDYNLVVTLSYNEDFFLFYSFVICYI